MLLLPTILSDLPFGKPQRAYLADLLPQLAGLRGRSEPVVQMKTSGPSAVSVSLGATVPLGDSRCATSGSQP